MSSANYRGQVTITTGTALAPDDDAPPDAEHASLATATTASRETGVSLVVSSEVVSGISLTIAPDVASDTALAVAPAVSLGPDAPEVAAPAQPKDDIAHEVDSPLLAVISLSTAETPATPARVPLADRLRAAVPFTGPGLTGLGGAILGCLVVGLGAEGDLALGHSLGTGFTATFLLGCVLVACALRTRALAVAVVLPPLLFAGGYALETTSSGLTTGRKAMALDVALSLALNAPLLFIGTALTVAVVLIRVAVHLVRR